MFLKGKGFYIWQIKYCNGGDIQSILADCQRANLTHVLIKIADGVNRFNYDADRAEDIAAPLVKLLQRNQIKVWGWHYLRGVDAFEEARVSYTRIQQLELDGFTANAEWEFKAAGKDIVARTFMQEMRNVLPDLPMALSSYRFPTYHPQFPYQEFLDYCDINMPQVYWQGAHNPAGQLARSVSEYQNIEPVRPIIPTGSVYAYDGWQPTPEEVQAYLEAVTEMKFPATNFWSWDNCRYILPRCWDVVRDYQWVDPDNDKDITDDYFEALNAKDPVKLTSLFTQDGVHVSANRTIQGTERLLGWFNDFTQNLPEPLSLQLTGKTGSGNSRHITWEMWDSSGVRHRSRDTFGLRDGKISYHFSAQQ